MDRIKGLVREPALLIDLAESLLVVLVAFGLPIHGDQETYIVAVLVALAGLAKGVTTTPFPVTIVTDLGRAVLVLAMSFGLHISMDQVALIVTFLGTVTTSIARGQITPRSDAVVAPAGSGSGPVTATAPTSRHPRTRGEDGVATVGGALYALGVLFIFLMVLSLVGVIALSWVVCLVVAVACFIVAAYMGRGTRV